MDFARLYLRDTGMEGGMEDGKWETLLQYTKRIFYN